MDKIRPCLWYDGQAEEAANFYVSLFGDGEVEKVVRSPLDNPGSAEGSVMMVEFRLANQHFLGLNGGPYFKFNEAVSFSFLTEDQAETDRLWDALTADGGEESECGWLKDRYGMSWQITPRRLMELVGDPDRDKAKRAMSAMMTMKKIDIATIERAAEQG